jgi:hypothetical protein
VQRSPTDCGASLCVIKKHRECGDPGPRGGCRAKKQTNKLRPGLSHRRRCIARNPDLKQALNFATARLLYLRDTVRKGAFDDFFTPVSVHIVVFRVVTSCRS